MGPNGSGKSTLIEAISWALYGNKSESRNGREGIKRSGALPSEECSVELEFELGGVQYRLRRSLKGKDMKIEAELSAGGGMIARSDRAVSQKVEEILGMDHQAFFISVFARQKDLSALSVLTAGERKKLIMRMLQLDVLQDVIDNIRRDWKDGKVLLQSNEERLHTPDGRRRREVLEEEIGQLDGKVAALNASLEEANDAFKARENDLKAAIGRKEWAALKEGEYRNLERRVLEKEKELKERQFTCSNYERELQTLRDRLRVLPQLEAKDKEMREAVASRESMDAESARFERRKAAAQGLNRLSGEVKRKTDELSNARQEISKLNDPRSRLEQVLSNIRSAESEASGKQQEAALLDAEISRLRAEAGGLEARSLEITSLGPDSLCPTCGRQLGDHHGHLLSRFDSEKDDLIRRAEELECKLGKLRTELETLSRRRSALEDRKSKYDADVDNLVKLTATAERLQKDLEKLSEDLTRAQIELNDIGEVSFDQQAYNALKDRIVSLRPEAERFQALRGEGARLPQLEAQVKEIEQAIASKSTELGRAKEDLNAVGYTEGDLKAAFDAYDEAYHAREAAHNEIALRRKDIEHTDHQINDRRKAMEEILEIERGIAERARAVEHLATLERVMIDFKQNIMDRIVPTLSETSSQLFSDMTDSRYGGIELDEDYEMHIYDGRDKYPLSRFSGGESDLANLSLRLAISRALADRSGNDINFLILDEIFGSQDQVRKRNIMGTLNRLEGQFQQIILISHIDDTKDLMSNVITIRELEDGTSAIEM